MSQALYTFMKQQDMVTQIIELHEIVQRERLAQKSYSALSRAGVVFSVASWQSYVTNVTIEAYNKIDLQIRSPENDVPPWVSNIFNTNRASLEREILRFNTPNADKVREFFTNTLNFSPDRNWNIKTKSNRKWKANDISAIINFWLKVRHSIAHGSSLPDDTRNGPGKNKKFSLTHQSLLDCRDFFDFLANITDDDITSHMKEKFSVSM